ncbi:MAG TPA: hypothetical protein VGC41_08145 [Kofleriaceae bacterium]
MSNGARVGVCGRSQNRVAWSFAEPRASLAAACEVVRITAWVVCRTTGVVRWEIELGYNEVKRVTLDRRAGRWPERLRHLREDIGHYMRSERRRRSYPRAVKIKLSK